MLTRIDTDRIKTTVDLIATVEKYLGPGKKNGRWYEWLCPFHTEKTPSFKIKEGDSQWRCYGKCQDNHGDVIDFIGKMDGLGFKEAVQQLGDGFLLQVADPGKALEMQAAIRAESERKRGAEEADRQRTAAEKLATLAGKVDWYHGQVDRARAYWYRQGLDDSAIEAYKLGYAPECPTYQQSPSYVIPYFESSQLISIRHRLANPNGCGKYRPEFSGLPNRLFNADALAPGVDEISFDLLPDDERILCEGEVKAMVLTRAGLPAAAIAGKSAWDSAWAGKFAGLRRVYVALDPGAEREAWRIGQDLMTVGVEAVVPTLPAKPDDMMVIHEATAYDVVGILRQGRIVR